MSNDGTFTHNAWNFFLYPDDLKIMALNSVYWDTGKKWGFPIQEIRLLVVQLATRNIYIYIYIYINVYIYDIYEYIYISKYDIYVSKYKYIYILYLYIYLSILLIGILQKLR